MPHFRTFDGKTFDFADLPAPDSLAEPLGNILIISEDGDTTGDRGQTAKTSSKEPEETLAERAEPEPMQVELDLVFEFVKTVHLTPYNDGYNSIYGNVKEVVYAYGGDDTVSTAGGDDVLYLHGGHDRGYGGDGDDLAYGGAGEDRLYGGNGNDELIGGTHDDRLYGGNGNDDLDGGDDEDVIYGGAGDDTAYGGADDDRVYGGSGEDTLHGSTGNDIGKWHLEEINRHEGQASEAV